MHHVGACHFPLGLRTSLLVGLALATALLLFAASASARTRLDKQPRAILDLAATPSWTLPVVGSGNDIAMDVRITNSGAVYAAGYLGTASHGADVSLVKIVNGAAAWAQPMTYDSRFHGDDMAIRMALGPGDVIYTAGNSQGANGKDDLLLVKWSATGKVLWVRRYDGPAHSAEKATGVVVDAAGNVTVAALSADAGGKYDGCWPAGRRPAPSAGRGATTAPSTAMTCSWTCWSRVTAASTQRGTPRSRAGSPP